MQRRMWIGMMIVVLALGLAMTTGCAKKAVKAGPADRTAELGDQGSQTEADRLAAQQRAEEERARLQRLEEERLAEQKRREEGAMTDSQRRQAYMAGREEFMSADVYFAFDSAVLSETAQAKLREKAAWLRQFPDDNVLVEGHCDERGSNEYNLALGDRRAQAAKNFLVDLGINPMRIETVSYGEERPVDPGHNEAAWARNRRAHFVLK